MTANGSSQVTAWAAAFGTPINLTGAGDSTSPTVVTDGPDGQAAISAAVASLQFLAMSQSTVSALTWTQGVGDIWTAPLVRTNAPAALWDGLSADPVHIFARTVNQDFSFSYAGGTMTIQLAAGIDLNAQSIVVPKDTTAQKLFGVTRNDMAFRYLEIRHYVEQVLAPQGDRNAVRECDIGFTCDDGFRPGGSAQVAQFNRIRGCGPNRSLNNGPGGGISLHGGAGHKLQYSDIADCPVSGIHNEGGICSDIEGNTIVNRNQPIRALGNASYPVPATWGIRANSVTMEPDDQSDDAIIIDGTHNDPQTFNITDNVFTRTARWWAGRSRATDRPQL